MNDQQLEKKIRQDVSKVKQDFGTLVGDSTTRVSRLGNNMDQAAEDVTTWVEDGVTQFSDGVVKLTGDTMVTVTNAAAAMGKDASQKLSQYNAKAQQVADNLPGSLGQKIARYPWVAISITLGVGFLLGSLLSPTRRFLW